MGRYFKKTVFIFCNDIKEYLKIISGNYHHIRELAQVVENQKASYYKMSKNLMSRKMELYRKGDINNWQLDIKDKNQVGDFSKDRLTSYKKICFKDTNNTIKNKEKYAYYLNRLISEYVRMRNLNAFENKEKVRQFAKKQGQIMSEYFKKMGEIIILIDGCMINDAGENLLEQPSEPFINVYNIDTNNENHQQEEIKEEENKNQIIENEII